MRRSGPALPLWPTATSNVVASFPRTGDEVSHGILGNPLISSATVHGRHRTAIAAEVEIPQNPFSHRPL